MSRRPRTVAICLVTLILSIAAEVHGVESPWLENWTSDLVLLSETLPETHPAPDAELEEFHRQIEVLRRDLPELEQHEITVRLMTAVAAIGDGHTRLTMPFGEEVDFMQGHSSTDPPGPEFLFHTLPIRVGIYDEGVFVQRIAGDADFVGAKVTGIGDRSIEQAIELVTPTIRHDNQSQLLGLLPMHLVTAEILHATGVTSSPGKARFQLKTADGVSHDLELSVETRGSRVWHDAKPSSAPLSHRFLREGRFPSADAFTQRHWIEWLPENGVVYVQFNDVLDDEDETIHGLALRLRESLKHQAFDRLIIDLRYNPGGNATLNRPLLHALIASEKVNEPGRLFVLIGRDTFSAAMMLAVDLERHLTPIFVGESTGSSPNHYGDSRKTVLPNTGLTVRISTLEWQVSDPRDRRDAIEPHVPVPMRWSDVSTGRDRALELVLEPSTNASLNGTWLGASSSGLGLYPLEAEIEEKGRGWIGKVRLEASSPIETEVKIDSADGLISFTLPAERWTIDFIGRRLGSIIAGQAVVRGREGLPFAFCLRR